MSDAAAPTLELKDLDVVYRVRGRDRQILRGVSLTIGPGETYGLVGESGCGKSTTALAVVGYLASNGRIRSGSIRVAGREVVGLSNKALRELRANDVSMVYQNPGEALNPSIRVGDQVAEVFHVRGASNEEAMELTLQALSKVQIADPESVMARYPHQLSGGMQQRVVIAMALANDPALLILDEPTTSLDATVEAEVLDLIQHLQAEFRTSVLFITHNLGVIAKMCERVGVLYAGRLVEEGPVDTVLKDPRHPYTVGLLRCVPRGGARKDRGRLDTIPGFLPSLDEELRACVFANRCGLAQDVCRASEPPLYQITEDHSSRCYFHEQAQALPRATPANLGQPVAVDRSKAPLLAVKELTKTFEQSGRRIHALEAVSAALWPGETLGLVGESGSGKTTFARAVLGLFAPTAGTVELDAHVAGSVRLAERYLTVRPSQLSGGLKQRVAIARAFAGEPRLVVCDEPTSALDVSVQAAILNLLVELQAQHRVAYLFISHDLGVVRYISDRIAVLYLGRLMEMGPAEVVFDGPHHPYTEALLSAVPTIDGGGRARIKLAGEIPSAAAPPTGCVFHTRCHRRIGAICDQQEPPLVAVEPGHLMRCHIPIEELRRLQRPATEAAPLSGSTKPAA